MDLSETKRLPGADELFFASAHIKTRQLTPGQLVRTIRKNMAMTQCQLAHFSGLSQAHIARIEAGKSDPKWSTLVMILKQLYAEPVLLAKPGFRYYEVRAERRDEWDD